MEHQKRQETIVYGGAFHPPTRAHQAILQACIDYADQHAADIWLLPSASRHDKKIRSSREYRLDLCQALIDDILTRMVRVSINTRELDRQVPTETYDTVQEFATVYPDRRFRWVFGMDSVATMPTWHQGEWLYHNLPMLVVDRPGTPPVRLGENAEKLAVYTEEMSSTEVRKRMRYGQSYDELVGANVAMLLARAS